jgi:hypothetical protein
MKLCQNTTAVRQSNYRVLLNSPSLDLELPWALNRLTGWLKFEPIAGCFTLVWDAKECPALWPCQQSAWTHKQRPVVHRREKTSTVKKYMSFGAAQIKRSAVGVGGVVGALCC